MTPARWRRASSLPRSFLYAALVLGGAAGSARADQFILFQETFEITKATVDKAGSHYFVRGAALNQPPSKDWTSPVDYRNGNVHIRTEVLEKPAGGEPNHWSYCYMPNRPIGPGYGCAGSGRYTEKGVFDRIEKMTSWWQNTAISWPQGIKEMHLVIKGTGDSGHLHKRADVEKLYPSKVRITMVQVSAGGTFDPSKVPGMENSPAPSDAGSGPAADAAAPPEGPTGQGGTAGTPGNAGTPGSGGSPAGGESPAGTGGSPALSTGGAPAATGTGGSPSAGTGGVSGGTGSGGAAAPAAAGEPVTGAGALGCSVGSAGSAGGGLALGLALLGIALASRRRGRRG